MTKEEAMYLLNNLRSVAEGKEDEAIDMAIEALQGGDAMRNDRTYTQTPYMQQSPNNGADLISRADAIERIANDNVVGGMDRINEYRNSTEHNDYLDGISTAIATIEDLPSADADRPQGEWIKENIVLTSNPPQRQWHCSECEHLLRGYENLVLDNYCPNCGTRMENKDE